MFIEEVDPSTNLPTDTYMLIPVIESSVSNVFEFDSSGGRTADVNLSESEAMVKLGSDPTALANHAPDSAEFQAILAAEGATHSNASPYIPNVAPVFNDEATAEMQFLEPMVSDDDINFITDIA